jgi:hypothetical protein
VRIKYTKVPRIDRPQYQSAKVIGLLADVTRTEIAIRLIRLAGWIAGAEVVVKEKRRKPWPPPPDTLLGYPIVEDPSLQPGEIVFGTVEQIGDPNKPPKDAA